MAPPRGGQFSTTTNGACSDRHVSAENHVVGVVVAGIVVATCVVVGCGAVVVTRRIVVVVRRRVVVVRRSVVRVVVGTVVGGSVVVVSTGPVLTDRLTVEPFATFLPGCGSAAYTMPAATVSFGRLTGLARRPARMRAATATSWVWLTTRGTATFVVPPPPPLVRATMIKMMISTRPASPAHKIHGGGRRWSSYRYDAGAAAGITVVESLAPMRTMWPCPAAAPPAAAAAAAAAMGSSVS